VRSFERKRRLYRFLRSQVDRFPRLHRYFWQLNRYIVKSRVLSAAWEASFERHRLKLPVLTPEGLRLTIVDSVIVPGLRQSDFDEDANLHDLMFLLQLSKARRASRILEIGTYRAKTSYALYLNNPAAFIRSYDIRRIDSDYRKLLQDKPNVELCIGSFSEQADLLKKEEPYDLIFIDGSHRLEDVLNDSLIAFQIVAESGAVVWHDYRKSGYWSPDLQVPEALHHLQAQFPIWAVKDTNCAIHFRG
jgi:predicted O-methyltransferase YrrM